MKDLKLRFEDLLKFGVSVNIFLLVVLGYFFDYSSGLGINGADIGKTIMGFSIFPILFIMAFFFLQGISGLHNKKNLGLCYRLTFFSLYSVSVCLFLLWASTAWIVQVGQFLVPLFLLAAGVMIFVNITLGSYVFEK